MALGECDESDNERHLNEVKGPLSANNPEAHEYYFRNSPEDLRGDCKSSRYREIEGSEKQQTHESQARRPKDEEANAELTKAAAPPPAEAEDEEPRITNGLSSLSCQHEDFSRSPKYVTVRNSTSRLETEIYTVSYLIFFSILGTLARLGLQALTFYPGAPVHTGVLWANFAGSLIMGFLSEDRKLFCKEGDPPSPSKPKIPRSQPPLPPGDEEEPPPEIELTAPRTKQTTVKKTIPLYIGLATGFCGSFTSFSSFIRDAFLALSNSLPNPSTTTTSSSRSGGYSFLALLAVIILTISLCLSALQFGAHIALALDPYTPTLSSVQTRRFLDRAIVILALAAWLASLLLSIFPPPTHSSWRAQALFALVFAPPGCLLRFYLSRALNAKTPSFPLGTFTANILGTALAGIFFDLQHSHLPGSRSVGGGVLGCQILQGMMDGFCGCLTTVSTWVGELQGLRRRRHAYGYGAASVAVALAVSVTEMGPVRWGKGFREPACGGGF